VEGKILRKKQRNKEVKKQAEKGKKTKKKGKKERTTSIWRGRIRETKKL
jgi:hypothetical protein